jgi:hypothetical protein
MAEHVSGKLDPQREDDVDRFTRRRVDQLDSDGLLVVQLLQKQHEN